MPRAGIVGAGIQGRLLAWQLARQGWQITLFDKQSVQGQGVCSHAAGGMLSPVVESLSQDPLIFELGQEGLSSWKKIVPHFHPPVFFQEEGSLMVAHVQDESDFESVHRRLESRQRQVQFLSGDAVQILEPELKSRKACFFPEEAQIDARATLWALWEDLKKIPIQAYFETVVWQMAPYQIKTDQGVFAFDWVFDCRGIGAQPDSADLRSVRGELIYLYAPAVHLKRPIRLLHPRYPIYMIPRPGSLYLVGATELESSDPSSMSVRSSLELLSAAYSLHAGFGEARIKELVTGLRPAFPDNLPRLDYQAGLIRINGLYRHGFLIAPVLVDEAIRLCEHGVSFSRYPRLIRESAYDCN